VYYIGIYIYRVLLEINLYDKVKEALKYIKTKQ
jgi:hypothetical protein